MRAVISSASFSMLRPILSSRSMYSSRAAASLFSSERCKCPVPSRQHGPKAIRDSFGSGMPQLSHPSGQSQWRKTSIQHFSPRQTRARASRTFGTRVSLTRPGAVPRQQDDAATFTGHCPRLRHADSTGSAGNQDQLAPDIHWPLCGAWERNASHVANAPIHSPNANRKRTQPVPLSTSHTRNKPIVIRP